MNISYKLMTVLALVAVLFVGCRGQEILDPQPAPVIITNESEDIDQDDQASSSSTKVTSVPSDHVRLSVTKDYGRETVYEASMPYQKGWTVYDLLASQVTLDTDYGGSFITGINGITSAMMGSDGLRQDWFYYVNGVYADVGALDYELQAGDSIWWDYHGWAAGHATNAVVTGGYPDIFINGYGKRSGEVQFLYMDGYEAGLQALADQLEAYGASITVGPYDQQEGLLTDRQGPTMLVGPWSQISEIPFLQGLNASYEKTGQFLNFTDQGLALMNHKNEPVRMAEEDTGVIFANGQGSGDDSPLWIVTGSSELGVQAALSLLRDEGGLSKTYSVVIEAGLVTKLPIYSEE